MKKFSALLLIYLATVLTGCATPTPYDYSAFRDSNPRSILVLPPVNRTLDTKASYSFLSQVTYPLAESGYYVFPVAVVDETFRENGMTNPEDIHTLPLDKLQNVFGADAALYIAISQYGTSYQVIASDTRVTAEASLIDMRSGALLWKGAATASSTEQNNNSSSLIGILVQALVYQIANSITDRSHQIAGITSNRLLSANMPNGILHGPRSPQHVRQ